MTKKNGGSVIASGGFGCVFRPALKCKYGKRQTNMISKLMTQKHALDEYNEILIIKEKLHKIPNYLDYFLLSYFNICIPDTLTTNDLIQFNKKCSALPKNNITPQNINSSLDDLLSLNMPYGGLPVDDYIYENMTSNKMIQLNNSLIQLLNKGIVPMNQQNIYHSDIKDSNILVDGAHTRLIDWGLSTEYTPIRDVLNQLDSLPKSWRNKPLQFNLPFSIILFSNVFVEKYSVYLREKKVTESELRPFVIDYIFLWLKDRGPGHYKYINTIMFMLFSKELGNENEQRKVTMIESEFTLFYISNYIVQILIHFNKSADVLENLQLYLDSVFIKLIDIWGFVISYVPWIEILFDNYNTLNEYDLALFNSIKQIFLKYLYNPRTEEISITDLTNDLRKLNNLLSNVFVIEKPRNNYSLANKINKSSTKTRKNRKKITGNGLLNVIGKYNHHSSQKIRNQIKKKNKIRNNYLTFLQIK